MGDTVTLHNVLFQWALYHCPLLLEDEELFSELLQFIHHLLVQTARTEARAGARRAVQPSRN